MKVDPKVYELAEYFTDDKDSAELAGNPRDAITKELAELIQSQIELFFDTL